VSPGAPRPLTPRALRSLRAIVRYAANDLRGGFPVRLLVTAFAFGALAAVQAHAVDAEQSAQLSG
jgi:hypothetical protein